MDVASDVGPVPCRVRKQNKPLYLKKQVLGALEAAYFTQVRRAEPAGSA